MGWPAQAQLTPPVVPAPTLSAAPAQSLAAAIERSWQRAVLAKETEGQRERAEAARPAATSWWAAPPALELSHRDDRGLSGAGRRESGVAVAWPLWLPGQRAARGATVDAATAQASAAMGAARLRIAGEVREAAWHVVAQQAALTQVDAQVKNLQQLADDVERRVRAGDLARADALAAHAERLAALAQQADLRQQLDAARARWKTLTGWDNTLDINALDEAASIPSATPATAALHPEAELARSSTEHAQRRLDLARVSRRDAPELTLGVRHDAAGGIEPTNNSLVFGLRLPFGTADRNRPMQATAQSERDIAQVTEQRLRERLDAEAATARNAVQAAARQLEAERERARLLRERASLIERAFRAGEFALPEVLRALAAAAQAETAAARQQAALGLARARLLQNLGVMP
jgi:outer membrane protein TolC